MADRVAELEWMNQLWWREAWFTLASAAPATLPPYLGSTIRGALGHLMRSALCDGSGCGHECQRKDSCRYYSLFEQDREGAKAFRLQAPPPKGLEDIAHGGPIHPPFRTAAPRPGETIPVLQCEAGWRFDSGEPLRFGLRIAGPISSVLPAIVEAIGRHGLVLAGSPFHLIAAHGTRGLLYERRLPGIPAQVPPVERLTVESEQASRIRVVFLSPVVFKLDRAPTFDPGDFARRFFEHSLGRALAVYQTCMGRRLPWVEAPALPVQLIGHRLFHYDLPRRSYRQDKLLQFDGVVGYLDLAGPFCEVLPWARAAEVFHFGQKAAFGLGKIRVMVLG